MTETDHGCWYEPEPEDDLYLQVPSPLLHEARGVKQEAASLSELLVDPDAGPPASLWNDLEGQLRREGLIKP